ncbi:oligosaccharide flippase family protein [Morganella morganii]|uniref:oligosaccharide flippase family protein n=1 Tax=Morganella morganii TaxID=582 RepID=UPI0035C8615D
MIKSILSMITVKCISFISPILLIPALVNFLGISQYGRYNFILAISGLLSIFINYGFEYSASRDLSRAKSQSKINSIYTNTLACKFIIYILSTPILILICYYYNISKYLFGSISLFLFSQVLFPIYVFQGMKRMGFLIYNTLFLNIIFLIYIILLITLNSARTVEIVFVGYAIINIISAIQLMFFIKKRLYITIESLCIKNIIAHFQHGWWIFLSRITSSGLSHITIILLASILSEKLLGIYTLSDKIIRAINSFYYAIQQAVYPYLCNAIDKKKILYTISLFILLSFSLLMILVLFFKSQIIYYFPSINDHYYFFVLMITSILPMTISGMFGINYLLVNNANRTFTISIALGAITNILMLLFYVQENSLVDSAITLVISETIVLISMLSLFMINFCKKKYENN